MNDREMMDAALYEARIGYAEGGIPIGAVLVTPTGEIAGRGHNLRMQTGDTTAHAEIVCLRNAGRRRDWHKLTLVSTLSPCIMCSGAALLHCIPRILIGENCTFPGAEDLLREKGAAITVLEDNRCIELMRRFIRDNPDLWDEDIGIPPSDS